MDKKANADIQISSLENGKVHLLLDRSEDLFEFVPQKPEFNFLLTSKTIRLEVMQERIKEDIKMDL